MFCSNILHQTQTLPGSSGSPIMNLLNYKIIGIHKGEDKNRNWNLGTLLKLPIEKFKEEFCNKEDIKNNNNNIINQNNSYIKNKENILKNKNEDIKVNNPKKENEFSLFNQILQGNIYEDNKNKVDDKQLENQINLNDKNENNHQIKIEDNPNIENYENINKQNNNEQIQNLIDLKNDIAMFDDINIIDSNLLINNNNFNNNEQNIVDEITIIYSKANIKSNNFLDSLKFKIASAETFSENKLFGEKFVKNNINNCKIIINGKQYNLSSYIKEEYNEYIYYLELTLKGVSRIINMDNMFCGCLSLTAVPDIDKLNTKRVIYMSNIFSGCESLISLPDISKWNIKNVRNINDLL